MRGGPFHAFVDESIRTDGFYRLTAVRVRSRDLAMVGRAIRERVPKGQRRVHLSSEGARRRRQILRAFAALDIAATVYRTPYNRNSNDQPARDLCLRALISDVVVNDVAVLVLDTRGEERDRRDRRTLRSALVGGGIERVAYTHRGSRDESLLALPDAIGWASGAARSWSRIVSGILEVRNVDEKG